MMRSVCPQMLGQGQGQAGVGLHVPPYGQQEVAPGLVGHDPVHQPAVQLAPTFLHSLALCLT